MFKFFHIHSLRNAQLKEEEKLDIQLRCLKCKTDVNEYLLNMRSMNRQMTDDISKISFYNMPNECIKYIGIIEGIQTRILNSEDMCQKIREINKELVCKVNEHSG